MLKRAGGTHPVLRVLSRGAACALAAVVLFVAFEDMTSVHVVHPVVVGDTGVRWNSQGSPAPSPRAVMLLTIDADAGTPSWPGTRVHHVVDVTARTAPPPSPAECRVAELLHIPMTCDAFVARLSLDRSNPDDRFAITDVNTGQSSTVVWAVADVRGSTNVLALLLFAVRVALVVIALTVVLWRPKPGPGVERNLAANPVVWDMFFICVPLAFGLTWNPTWAELTWSAVIPRILVPAALLYAAARTVRLLTRYPLPGIVPLQQRLASAASWIFVGSAVFFAWFDVMDVWYHTPLTGFAYAAGVTLIAVGNLGVIAVLYRAVAGAVKDVPDKKRLAWVGLSLCIGFSAVAASGLWRVLADQLRADASWPSQVMLLPAVATPAGLAYAILRLNAINLDLFIRRATAASLISTIVLLAVELSLKVLEFLGKAPEGNAAAKASGQQVAVVASVLAGVVLHRYADTLAAFSERLFFKEWSAAKAALENALPQMQFILTPEEFSRTSVQLVSGFLETGASFYVPDSGGWLRHATTWAAAPVTIDAEDRGLRAALAARNTMRPAASDSAIAHQYAVVLRFRGRAIAVLCGRGRDARQPYSSQETDAILHFAAGAAPLFAALLLAERSTALRTHMLAESTSPAKDWMLSNGYLDAADR